MFKLQIMRSGCMCGGSKEGFHGAVHARTQPVQHIRTLVKQNALTTIIFLIFAVLAFYLSWTCNTKEGIEVMWKVIYGIFAGLSNIIYVFWYFTLRRSYCL